MQSTSAYMCLSYIHITVPVLSVGQTTYTINENSGSLTLSYNLDRSAVRDVTFDVINIDGTATGGGVGKSH